jgi:AcrR family transcriptional regulator
MAKPVEGKRLSAEERRASILAAAGTLFGDHGYEATRLDDIALATGVSKPILYRHFDGKRALYLALLERHRDDLGSFTGMVPREGPRDERLQRLLEIWLAYVEEHSYAWKMLLRDVGGGPEVQRFRLTVHERARAVLAEMIRSETTIPRGELEPLAELMSMGMASLVLWWLENPGVPRAVILNAMARAWGGILIASQ